MKNNFIYISLAKAYSHGHAQPKGSLNKVTIVLLKKVLFLNGKRKIDIRKQLAVFTAVYKCQHIMQNHPLTRNTGDSPGIRPWVWSCERELYRVSFACATYMSTIPSIFNILPIQDIPLLFDDEILLARLAA